MQGRRPSFLSLSSGVKDFPLACPTCRKPKSIDPEKEDFGLRRNVSLANVIEIVRKSERASALARVGAEKAAKKTEAGAEDEEGAEGSAESDEATAGDAGDGAAPAELPCDLCQTQAHKIFCTTCSLYLCTACRDDTASHFHPRPSTCVGFFLVMAAPRQMSRLRRMRDLTFVPHQAHFPFRTPESSLPKAARFERVYVSVTLQRVRLSAKFEAVIDNSVVIPGKKRESVLVRTCNTDALTEQIRNAVVAELTRMFERQSLSDEPVRFVTDVVPADEAARVTHLAPRAAENQGVVQRSISEQKVRADIRSNQKIPPAQDSRIRITSLSQTNRVKKSMELFIPLYVARAAGTSDSEPYNIAVHGWTGTLFTTPHEPEASTESSIAGMSPMQLGTTIAVALPAVMLAYDLVTFLRSRLAS